MTVKTDTSVSDEVVLAIAQFWAKGKTRDSTIQSNDVTVLARAWLELRVTLAERDVDVDDLNRRVKALVVRDPWILRCAFCDEEYPPGTSDTQSAALTDHVLKCEKHPLAVRIKKLELDLFGGDSALSDAYDRKDAEIARLARALDEAIL